MANPSTRRDLFPAAATWHTSASSGSSRARSPAPTRWVGRVSGSRRHSPARTRRRSRQRTMAAAKMLEARMDSRGMADLQRSSGRDWARRQGRDLTQQHALDSKCRNTEFGRGGRRPPCPACKTPWRPDLRTSCHRAGTANFGVIGCRSGVPPTDLSRIYKSTPCPLSPPLGRCRRACLDGLLVRPADGDRDLLILDRLQPG